MEPTAIEAAQQLLQEEPPEAPTTIDVQAVVAAYGSAHLRINQLEQDNLRLREQVVNLRNTLRNLVRATDAAEAPAE